MIITDFYLTRDDGVNLYRTYSDQNLRIKCEQTNAIYDEAVNVEGYNYTYIETNEQIDKSITNEFEEAAQAVDILLGRTR